MLVVLAVELALVIGTPALPRMAVMIACAGVVPDLIAQRAGKRPLSWWRVGYMAWIGAQVGLAIYAWLPFATELPMVLAIVLDQTVFTIPILLTTLVLVNVFGGRSLSEATHYLALGHWRTSPAWRTLRVNWLFWALFAKPLELSLVHWHIVSAEDVVYVDAALIVVWYTILSTLTHAPRDAPRTGVSTSESG